MQAQFKSGTNSRLKNSHQIQANAHFNFEAEFCRALVSLCITVLCCAFLALCYVLFNLMPVQWRGGIFINNFFAAYNFECHLITLLYAVGCVVLYVEPNVYPALSNGLFLP